MLYVCADKAIEEPVRTALLVAVTLAFLPCTALPQVAEFYVVQDARTKKCKVVDKKPTPTTYETLVSSGSYRTRAEAEDGIQNIKVCAGQ